MVGTGNLMDSAPARGSAEGSRQRLYERLVLGGLEVPSLLSSGVEGEKKANDGACAW